MYWMVDHLGNPVETKKRIFGQAFTLYALAEYASASAEKELLEEAIARHRMIEGASHDDRLLRQRTALGLSCNSLNPTL